MNNLSEMYFPNNMHIIPKIEEDQSCGLAYTLLIAISFLFEEINLSLFYFIYTLDTLLS